MGLPDNANGEFDGYEAKVNTSDDSRRMDIYYGGDGSPDGAGHGHVAVVNDQVQFWREPENDGGEVLIDYGSNSQIDI